MRILGIRYTKKWCERQHRGSALEVTLLLRKSPATFSRQSLTQLVFMSCSFSISQSVACKSALELSLPNVPEGSQDLTPIGRSVHLMPFGFSSSSLTERLITPLAEQLGRNDKELTRG